MTLDDSALAGAPKLATDYLVYLQWASHLTNLGDLGKKGGRGEFYFYEENGNNNLIY